MKQIKRILSAILVMIIFLSLFCGCNKEKEINSDKGYIYTEFYSGPETYYPDNMPAATRDIVLRLEPTKGYIQGSRYPITLNDILNKAMFSEEVDSWYRVTVNRVLGEGEARKLNDYQKVGGVQLHTFYEVTLWYDYVRQEKVEKEIILILRGTEEQRYSDTQLFLPGESYIILLALQFKDWDFAEVVSQKCNYQIISTDRGEILTQYTDKTTSYEGYNKGFSEFTRYRVDSSIFPYEGYTVYDLEAFIIEIQQLFFNVVNDNDRYIFPTYTEYIEEYQIDRTPFLKQSENSNMNEKFSDNGDKEIDIPKEDKEGLDNESE